jgi:hypothetical protein
MGLDLILAVEENETLHGRLRKFVIGSSFTLPLLATGLVLLVKETPLFSLVMAGGLTRSMLFTGLTFALLAAACLSHWPKSFLGTVAMGLTFADLFIAGAGWNPAIPTRWAIASTPPAVRFLQQDKGVYRVAGLGPVMPPSTATLCGLQDIRGYDVPVGHRYHTFFQKALGGKVEWWRYDLPTLAEGSLGFLSLLNVRYILSLNPLPPPLSLVYDKEVKIYENLEAFPRAFLVHRVETVKDGSAALERIVALGSELRRVAVLEGSLPEGFPSSSLAEKKGSKEDRVQIIQYTARQVEVHVDASSPGLLVLGDTYFPGWKAYVDEKEATVYRADYLLKAVAVDKGSHRIVFFYQPLSFRVGLGLTAVAGVIILWCLRLKRRPVEEG